MKSSFDILNGEIIPFIFLLYKLFCIIFEANFLNSFVRGQVYILSFYIDGERCCWEVNAER